ncbi:hypothetical protein M408DRAFT_191738 [Serendipita vermifera MAFF 305830]|uniref:Uncharacterized protein n=1 Tax=Serendipita vermifera MAFF 305830 TaxID=933852 RepID=A0A0C3B8F5_SERVB|nr:hypothetical protein M408DRAFT_191738 [Serendipita vermifera MAFF 305830]
MSFLREASHSSKVAVVFALLVWKALSTPRDTKTPMLMLLIRDGFIYFGVVFAAFLFNLLVWALAPLSLALLPHDPVWAIVTIALSRLMLSMDGISPNGIISEEEGEDTKTTHQPLSHGTIPANLRRTLEQTLTFPRSRSQTPVSKIQSQHSLAETIIMEGSELGDRRSSKGSSRSQRGNQRPPSVVQKEASPNPAWFPGAIEEKATALRSRTPSSPIQKRVVSPTPSDRSDSPPLAYIRPLPTIPGTTSFMDRTRTHSRSFSASPLPGQSSSRPNVHHQSSNSASGSTLFTLSQPSTVNGQTSSATSSNTQLLRRFSTTHSLPNPGGPQAEAGPNLSKPLIPLANREVHEMRLLPPRPSHAPVSSDSNPWTETPWPEIATYPRVSQQEVVDRRGDFKTTNSGGVEF